MKNREEGDFVLPDFTSKEYFIKEFLKFSENATYTKARKKIIEEPFGSFFLGAMKRIEAKSMDITQDYTCIPIIGLSLSYEYGEKARVYFHKICKQNIKYNIDVCNREYSKYLKNESILLGMLPVYFLYAEKIREELGALIEEKENASKL
ncbi:hypothetical protein [Polaribacter sp. 20A6]|uniref:hypothetical protein n=1 Tax=Polaribacter sp. 20A6 TaxID=2687289 RepID=UPI0013FD4BB0|nr:hypothetical protein [Polaribacter sp. 20A6]